MPRVEGSINAHNPALYRFADQVDSAVLTTNNGADHSRRLYAYGRKRYGTTDTLYRYGGQMEDGTGLIYMNARYYDPQMGLFISPDTIIPDPTNVLDYNRYAYARGNPIRYNDPSGHFACANDDAVCYNAHGKFADGRGGWTRHGTAEFANMDILNAVMADAGITFQGEGWTWARRELVAQGTVAFANKISNFNNVTGLSDLRQLMGGGARFYIAAGRPDDVSAAVGFGQAIQGEWLGIFNQSVNFYENFFDAPADWGRGATAHELAHVIDFNSPFGYQWLSANIQDELGGFELGPGDHDGQSYERFAEATAQWVYEPSFPGGANPYQEAWGIGTVDLPPDARTFLGFWLR